MSGGIITVALSVFERLSGRTISLWVYVGTLNFFLLMACYLAWREAGRAIAERGARRREYIIDRLKDFIREGVEIQSWGGLRYSKIENWGRISVMHSYKPRVEKFLREFLGDTYVRRFQDKHIEALEEVVKELLD